MIFCKEIFFVWFRKRQSIPIIQLSPYIKPPPRGARGSRSESPCKVRSGSIRMLGLGGKAKMDLRISMQ